MIHPSSGADTQHEWMIMGHVLLTSFAVPPWPAEPGTDIVNAFSGLLCMC